MSQQPLPAYQSVIFDFDGTLADSVPGILATLKALIEECGFSRHSDEYLLESLIGPPLHLGFRDVFGIHDKDELERVILVYRRLFDEIALPMLKAFPGVLEMLRDLHNAGVTTCIASCKIHAVCVQQADIIGIAPYIRHICGARPEENLLEKTDIVKHVLCDAKLDKSSAAMVGDRMLDIIGAHAAEIAAIGVTFGSGTPEELRAHNALHIVDSVEELHALLLPR